MTSLQQTAMGGGSATAKTASYTLVAADAGATVIMNSASATTITVNTSLFSAGDTVFLQNIGAGVSTITAGTATVNTASSLALAQYESGTLYFTAAGASIFSKADGAAAGGGFTFQTWSPSYTNLTIGNGTVTSRYGTSGKFTFFEWTLTFGSTTSISGSPEITLPTTPKNTGYSMWQGNIGYLDAGTNIYLGHINIIPATSKIILYVDRANQTYLEYAGLDATTPFTWTTNDRISVSGQYEEA